MKLKRLVLSFVLSITFVTATFAAGKPVTDDYLTDMIRSRLAADQIVKGGAIEVTVKDGAVILKGTVEEDKQKSKAEKIAKKVSGVKSVDNEIVVHRP
jgi:hyperosmotically inducible periplasmic protein